MTQAKVALPLQLRASQTPELRECLMRKWPDHHGPGHLLGQSCEDVSGTSGLTTSVQGISAPRVLRMSQAKLTGPPWGRASPRSDLRGFRRMIARMSVEKRAKPPPKCLDVPVAPAPCTFFAWAIAWTSHGQALFYSSPVVRIVRPSSSLTNSFY